MQTSIAPANAAPIAPTQTPATGSVTPNAGNGQSVGTHNQLSQSGQADQATFSFSSSQSSQFDQDLGKILATMIMMSVLFGNDDDKKSEDSNLLMLLALSGGFSQEQYGAIAGSSSSQSYTASGAATQNVPTGTQVNTLG